MAWDSAANRTVTLARLKLAPPHVVYQELQDYGQFLTDVGRFEGDEKLERALVERHEPLIDLGLAANASSPAVVAGLYNRALAGTGDEQHDWAMRLACLANPVATRQTLLGEVVAGLPETEMRRIALEGEWDELFAAMKNPSARAMLANVYGGKGPFEGLPTERLRRLVWASIGNPRLNMDESNEDGPDLMAMDIQRGIFRLLLTAPTTDDWVRTLYPLLLDIEPLGIPAKVGEPAKALQRWANVRVPARFGKDGEDEAGLYTQLTYAEEFRCLIGALYGRTFENKAFINIGRAEDEDVTLRCAYYGFETMEPDAMRQAFAKDEAVFAFAALFNDNVMQKRERRAVLEDQLRGDLFRLYTRRCGKLTKRWKWFDPRPVSENTTEVLEMMEMPTDKPSAESTALAVLQSQVDTLRKQLSQQTTIVTWGLVLLAALVWFRH